MAPLLHAYQSTLHLPPYTDHVASLNAAPNPLPPSVSDTPNHLIASPLLTFLPGFLTTNEAASCTHSTVFLPICGTSISTFRVLNVLPLSCTLLPQCFCRTELLRYADRFASRALYHHPLRNRSPSQYEAHHLRTVLNEPCRRHSSQRCSAFSSYG